MPVSVPNEIQASFGNKVFSLSNLIALLAVDSDENPMAGLEMPADLGPFPMLTWTFSRSGQRGTDAEGEKGGIARIQLDAWGSDPVVLNNIVGAINGLADPGLTTYSDGSLDTDSFVVTILRLLSDWRKIDWPSQIDKGTGKPLVQLSSDWEMRFGLRQS